MGYGLIGLTYILYITHIFIFNIIQKTLFSSVITFVLSENHIRCLLVR